MKAYMFGYGGVGLIILAGDADKASQMAYEEIGEDMFPMSMQEGEVDLEKGLVIRAESYESVSFSHSVKPIPKEITYGPAKEAWKIKGRESWNKKIAKVEAEIQQVQAIGGPKAERKIKKARERIELYKNYLLEYE